MQVACLKNPQILSMISSRVLFSILRPKLYPIKFQFVTGVAPFGEAELSKRSSRVLEMLNKSVVQQPRNRAQHATLSNMFKQFFKLL